MHSVCSIYLIYARYIISMYDLYLAVILLYSPQKSVLLCFHYISTCSQFVRTGSCLLLWRRQSENIEPAPSTERQYHQRHSDLSKKVLDEQSRHTTFYFSCKK